MSLHHYFVSPHGRISRQAFWLGFVILFTVTIPVSVWLDPTALETFTSDPNAANRVPSLANTLWSLALTWPSAAISIKRFNDRDWPRWIGYLLGAMMAMLTIANAQGLLLDPDTMSPPEKLVFGVVLVFFMWSLIDNGFQKGSDGPNRHGPDPLAMRTAFRGE